MSMGKKLISTNLLLVMIIGAIFFASGFYIGKGNKVIISPLEDIDLSLLAETYYLLENNHPEFSNMNENDLVHGAIKGIIDVLNDDHTVFLDKERSKMFMDDVRGEFEGVGMEIGIRDNKLQVISPLMGTPAYNAGIKSGDIVISIDKESTESMNLYDAVSRIRGPKGEEVVLEIMRDNEISEISIIRDVIEVPSIEWKIIDDNIAYIQLFSFHDNISRDFDKIATEIKNGSVEKIILDLRGNAGGLLNVAINIASYFIESGDTVLYTSKNSDGSNSHALKASRKIINFFDYPLVVLVDQGSASASEIVAGALQDQCNAVVVGTNSFGKGSVQKMHELSDGSTVKITEQYFFTPHKKTINNKGINPDIEIEITKEDIEENNDPQLKKAIEIINNL